MINFNMGISLAYQSVNGILYLKNDEYKHSKSKPLFWKLSPYLKVLVVTGITVLSSLIILKFKPHKNTTNVSNITLNYNDETTLSNDLYEIRNIKGKYDT